MLPVLSLPALPFPSPKPAPIPEFRRGIAIGVLPVLDPRFGPFVLGVVEETDGIQRVYAGLEGRALPGLTPGVETPGDNGRFPFDVETDG